MDFISESFPNTRVHYALYKLNTAKTDDEKLIRNKLAQLVKENQANFTVINAECVISLMHLNIAVSKALVNRRDAALKTSSFGTEVVYYCSPNNSIDNCLEHYGIKQLSKAFFAVFVDMQNEQIQTIKTKIQDIDGVDYLPFLNNHVDYQNQEKILTMFNLPEKERALPMQNAIFTSMYNKLALKRL